MKNAAVPALVVSVALSGVLLGTGSSGMMLRESAASTGTSWTAKARADTFVRRDTPRRTYGQAARWSVDGRAAVRRNAYVKFRVRPAPEGRQIKRARLSFYSNTSSRGRGVKVYVTSNRWRESRLTWRRQPARGVRLGRVAGFRAGSWVTVDVTRAIPRRGDATVSFRLQGAERRRLWFRSSEHPSGRGPRLTFTTEPVSAGTFPVGVWLQEPAANADEYKALGVNRFVGLWEWPHNTQADSGWAQRTLDALAAQDMTALAGQSAAAVRDTLTLRNNGRIEGWVAGDEPDMFGPDPAGWKANIEAMRAVQDRPVWGNFGQGFSGFGWWYDHITDAQRAAWCAPLDIASVDWYGMTSPEPPEHLGPWTYGRAVDNLQKACGGKPTWDFVEVTEPCDTCTAATPKGIRAAVWNAVIHGADGIEYFIHDMKCNPECGPWVFLSDDKWAANRRAMSNLNAELHRYGDILATPDVTGVATSTGIKLGLLAKRVGSTTYVFAQADGSAAKPGGYTGTATVTVNGQSVTDTWSAYQVRVYTFS